MTIKIQDYCIRCGLCVDLYPELFDLDYQEDILNVKYADVPAELQDKAKDAAKDCAIAAIQVMN